MPRPPVPPSQIRFRSACPSVPLARALHCPSARKPSPEGEGLARGLWTPAQLQNLALWPAKVALTSPRGRWKEPEIPSCWWGGRGSSGSTWRCWVSPCGGRPPSLTYAGHLRACCPLAGALGLPHLCKLWTQRAREGKRWTQEAVEPGLESEHILWKITIF